MTKKQNLLLMMTLALLVSVNVLKAQKKGKVSKDSPKLSFVLYLDELSAPIELSADQMEYSKFSETLRINAKGSTQYNNANTPFTFSLTLPGFKFDNGAKNNYSNESNYFFDAKKDAALTLQLGDIKFGNLFRSKEKENILSKVATTDYSISCMNQELKKDQYIILIGINSGTVLNESSETKSKAEVEKLHISSSKQSKIQISNPQPFLPKVDTKKFRRSSEIIYKR